MSGYRNISVSFWTDSKVDDDFTPEDKYFYLYLLTNPHTNLCGCYEISLKQMERETGYNTDTVNRLIRRMQETHGVIRYCSETKEVLILNWYKYNWAKSPKVRTAVISVASHLKHEPFKKYIIDMVSIRYRYDMDTTDTDTVSLTGTESITETITESTTENSIIGADKPHNTKKFTPPTVEEVRAYCIERMNSVDAERFVDYYSANGWMIGKNPMKDWKAAVRSWEKNRSKESAKKELPGSSSSSIDPSDLDKLMAMQYGN